DTIILDKTGTLTEGEPCVVHEKWFGDADMTKSILYSIERRSSHPLSTAITSHLDGTPTKIVLAFRNIPGQGLSAKIDGTTYYIGNMQLLRNNNINIDDDVLATSHAWSMEGGSIVIIADESSVLGMLSIADRLKSTSLPAIKSLKEMGIDIHICSGDSVEAADCIARQLGINHYRGMASPEDKSKYITSLQQEGHVVAMVGDGINDSAALSIADFSIAMGNGSDIAIDVAQMTIISGDLTRLRYAIKLSKDTAKTIRQNLFWALIYNCFAIPIAAGILYPINGFLLNPMVACALMAFSSVSVVTNSLRLRHKL
ncbi:MAG: HAD-IC family P-type ATPase, partial [Muribaculaceae bacterium]|nr:HAD-IC family P-type ATPase [Muribaculaceae bacterium]